MFCSYIFLPMSNPACRYRTCPSKFVYALCPSLSLTCSISETLRESNLLQKMGLSFPEIAVVGQESTGKSSVLERVLGLPLFPRGADITTRMPIRLRLSHLSAAELHEFCSAEKLRESDDGFYVRTRLINTTKAVSEVTECTPFEGPVHAGDLGAQVSVY